MASNSALMYAGATAGIDAVTGLFGYFASQEAAKAAESRGRMIRLEAEADAQRYAEQARGFGAAQRLAYLKSGVQLTGSPLDVLDADLLTAQENLASIRAGGASRALDAQNQVEGARAAGRSALVSGITSGVGKFAWASYASGKTSDTAGANRKNTGQRTVY